MELDLDAIEARHWHDESMRMCSLCMFEWPCHAVRMVAEVRRLRDENAALERKLNAALVDVVNMANEETAAAEAHEEALDRLRDENAQLDAICRWNREHVATVVDEEFGLRVGGMACEHPCLTGDRCDACGWTQAWEADRG